MFREILQKYPWVDLRTIHWFDWFRVRYYFDSFDDFKVCNYAWKHRENNIKKLQSFVLKIIKEFSRSEELYWSLICFLWNSKKIDGSFLHNNFPDDIKKLFHVKEVDIIKFDELYFCVFDLKNLKPDDISRIIFYLIIADTDFLNKDKKHIWRVYFYPKDLSRLLNLYDDRWMDICYETPENYFNHK